MIEAAPIVTLPPQTDWLLPAFAAGAGFTLTTAEPVPEFEQPLLSLTFVTV